MIFSNFNYLNFNYLNSLLVISLFLSKKQKFAFFSSASVFSVSKRFIPVSRHLFCFKVISSFFCYIPLHTTQHNPNQRSSPSYRKVRLLRNHNHSTSQAVSSKHIRLVSHSRTLPRLYFFRRHASYPPFRERQRTRLPFRLLIWTPANPPASPTFVLFSR